MEMEVELSNLPQSCRLCLTTAEPRFSIFVDDLSPQFACLISLPDNITSLIHLEVLPDDGLPNYICAKCYCQIKDFVSFKQQCETSYKFLQTHVDHLKEFASDTEGVEELERAIEVNHDDDDDNELVITESTGNAENTWSDEYVDNDCDIDLSIVKSEPDWLEDDILEHSLDIGEEILNLPPLTELEVVYDDSAHPLFDLPYEENPESDLQPQFIQGIISINFEPVSTGRSRTSRWKCCKCNKVYSQNGCTTHVKSVMSDFVTKSEEKSFKCHSCSVEFPTRSEVLIHVYSSHKACKYCGISFTPERPKQQHMCEKLIADSADHKTFKCHQCLLEFPTRREITIHSNSTHKPCRQCGVQFTPEHPKEEHVCSNGNASANNNVSGPSGDPNTTGREMRVRQKPKEVPKELPKPPPKELTPCTVCNALFESQKSMKIHCSRVHKLHLLQNETSDMHSTVMNQFCETILGTDTDNEMKRETFSCVFCPKTCFSYQRLAKHMKKAHKLMNDPTQTGEPKPVKRRVRKPKPEFKHDPFPKPGMLLNFEKLKDNTNTNFYKCLVCSKLCRTAIGAYNHHRFVNLKLNKKPNPVTEIVNKKLKQIHRKVAQKLEPRISKHPPFITNNGPLLKANFNLITNPAGVQLYKCIFCPKMFKTCSNALHHVQPRIKCKICKLKFRSKKQLDLHMTEHHTMDENVEVGNVEKEEKENTQEVVDIDFDPLAFKTVELNDKATYNCLHCSRKYPSYHGAYNHSKYVKSTQNTCWTCHNTFPNDKMLKLHLVKRHNQVKHKLSKTNNMKENKEEVVNDVISQEENNIGANSDKVEKNIVKKHPPFNAVNGEPMFSINFEKINISEGVDVYKCIMCERELKDYVAARNHYTYHKRKSKSRLNPKRATEFTCKACGAFFKTRSQVMLHRSQKHKIITTNKVTKSEDSTPPSAVETVPPAIRAISTPRGGRCEVCQEDYEDIKLHTRSKSHHRAKLNLQKTLPIDQVKEQDTDSVNKSKNMVNKRNIKRIIVCTKCYKIFPGEKDLINHMKSCDSQQVQKEVQDMFKCSLCAKEVGNLKKYIQHVKLKHEGYHINYKCEKCSKKYATRSGLRQHLSINHNIEIVEIDQKYVLCSRKVKKVQEKVETVVGSSLTEEVVANDKNQTVDPVRPSTPKTELNNVYNCALCEKTFHTEDELLQHIDSQSHIENRNLKLRKQ